MMKFLKFGLIICCLLLNATMAAQAQTTRYVREGGSGTGDGSSWTNASSDLQAMINLSSEGDEIWVAEGTYKPNRFAQSLNQITISSDNAFVLKADVKIYGGFSSIGTPNWAERNWNAYPTILSGNIGTNIHTYHVVISSGEVGTACLDGFTITGGNANYGNGFIYVNGEQIWHNRGGGIYSANSSPTITNVTISGNTASLGGGGSYNTHSSPKFTNVTISKNNGGGISSDGNSSPTLTYVTISGNSGGGIGLSSGTLTHVTISGNSGTLGGGISISGSATLTHVTISENWASYGGGMRIFNASPTLTNVVISGNTAVNSGGGIYNETNSSSTLINVLISGNTAVGGGGIDNSASSLTLTNVTISGNKSSYSGGGIHNSSSSYFFIQNSIIWGNGPNNVFNENNITIDYSLIQRNDGNDNLTTWDFTFNGDNNIIANPQFVSWEDPNLTPNTLGDYRLQMNSSAINTANNDRYLTARGITDFSGETDLDGKLRLHENIIDMVPYEYKGENYIITATAGENGVINPEGIVGVTSGHSKMFMFTPDNCYEIDELLIDDVVTNPDSIVSETGYYTFENVMSTHTIHVTFKQISNVNPEFTGIITEYCSGASIPALPTTSDNDITGTWSPAINNTTTTTYTFTPDADQCATTTQITLTITPVTSPFYTITATARSRGTITPSGTVSVMEGEDQTFTFTPFDGCSIDIVLIDGINAPIVAANDSYTFTNVNKNHTIEVFFACPFDCPDKLIDHEGNIYTVIQLVGLCWSSNMKNRTYSDGTTIPFARAYYSLNFQDTIQNISDFGLLYDWYSATRALHAAPVQGICPNGWRLPTSAELALLNIYPADDLKNPNYWLQPNSCSNSTGFDSRGAGYYNSVTKRFENLLGYTAYWSSDAPTANFGIAAQFNYYCNQAEIVDIRLTDAISVRCVLE